MEQNRLLLICVETTNKAKTDMAYIDKVLKTLYVIDNETKIDYEYMESKYKYNSKKVQNRINNKLKTFKNYKVILCVDTDNIDVDQSDAKKVKEIESFCKQNNYDFVWFCRNIEEVFWGVIVEDREKIIKAKMFGSKNKIEDSFIKALQSNEIKRNKSNFLIVFDKYLLRKKQREENKYFNEIKLGLEQALEYEKGNLKARTSKHKR